MITPSMGSCHFDHRTAAGFWQCAYCDYTYKLPADKPPSRNCPNAPDAPNAPDLIPIAERLAEETNDPSILTKAAHYGAALVHWSLSGFETRSTEEVAWIYTELCQPCKHFDPVADACKICGCNVRAEGMAVRNKIAMATEECPKGKW